MPISRQLYAIPVTSVPGRIAPRVGELFTGVAVSARRLRAVAFTMTASQDSSGPAWLRTAWSAAIVSGICGATLRTLADRAGELATPAPSPDKLRQTARAFIPACAAWRQAASMSQVITTDTRTTHTSATAETPGAADRPIRVR